MYQGQQMAPLPFSPQQLQTQPLQLSLNNPPFVPNVQTHPQIQPLVPLIAAACALEVQGKAQLNPLRMFMFNRHALNNFANQDFDNLVRNVVDYVHHYCFVRPEYNNLEIAVQDAVPKVVEMVCGMAVREFPQLEAYCTPETIRAVYASNARFMSIGAEINANRQRAQMGQMQPQMPMQGGWQGNQMQMQPQYHRGGWQGGQMQPAAAGMIGGPGPSGMFSQAGSARQPVASSSQSSGGESRWANAAQRYKTGLVTEPVAETPQAILRQPHQPRQTFDQAAALMETQEVTKQTAGELISYKEGMWTPKPGWTSWYLPAYNPLTHKLFVKTKPDGTLIPVVQEREMMDYEKHRIKTIFGPVNIAQAVESNNRFMEVLDKRLDEISDQPVLAEDEGTYNPVHTVSNSIIADTTQPFLWYVLHRDYFQSTDDDKYPDAYTSAAQLCESVLSLTDDMQAIRVLRELNTYEELRTKALELYKDKKLSDQMFGSIRKRMTNMINRVLSQNLAIPRLQIESFMDVDDGDENDYKELVAYLDQVYGPNILNSFYKHQKANIENHFRLIGDDLVEAMSDLSENDIKKGVRFNYLCMNLTMTLINCTSRELEIELFNDVSAVLTKEFSPVMLKIVKRIFQHVDDSGQFARHLIRTTDGVVLEVARGYLADDCYTLSRVE